MSYFRKIITDVEVNNAGQTVARAEHGWVRFDVNGRQEIAVQAFPPLRTILKDKIAFYLYIAFLPLTYAFVDYEQGSYADVNLSRIAFRFCDALWIIGGILTIAYATGGFSTWLLSVMVYAFLYRIFILSFLK